MAGYVRISPGSESRPLEPVFFWRYLLTGGLGTAAWWVLVAGLLLVRLICPHADLSGLTIFRHAPSELADVAELPEPATTTASAAPSIHLARGTVLHSAFTRVTVNERPIYQVRYQFHTDAQRLYEGESYKYGPGPEAGAAVVVEYLASNPAMSRIQGMRMKHLGAWAWFFALVPVVGLGLLLCHVRLRLRRLGLLRYGVLVFGDLAEKNGTGTVINGRRVFAYVYEFGMPDGEVHEARFRTHRPVGDEDGRALAFLADPANPSENVALDLLPGHPYLDEAGVLRATTRGLVPLLAGPVTAMILLAAIAMKLRG